MTTNPLPLTPALAPLETIKSPELIQNAFVVVPLCKWKLEPALRRLGKRFHHRHNAFPEFVKMLDDVSLTFFAMEVELHSRSVLTGRCRFQFRINRLLIAWKIRKEWIGLFERVTHHEFHYFLWRKLSILTERFSTDSRNKMRGSNVKKYFQEKNCLG